jgi:hypothetical protein
MTDTRRPTIIDISDGATGDAREPEEIVLPGLERVDAPDAADRGSRAYADWTEFEDTFLIQEHRRGRSVRSMADALDRTPGAVRQRLRKLDLT